MIKKLLAVVMAFIAASVFAASVDVNKATQAELEAVKNIGPATATKILDERKKGDFKDWSDLMSRVSGIKEARATQLSAAGLTVNGTGYGSAPAADKKEKAHAKPAAAKASEGAASSAKAEKPTAKGDKKKAADKANDAASKPVITKQ